ncbi:class I SAM-dependent rRNA methyltransferase [Roseiterribacter gracilis]|uniref:SAM-dependent methyltransferase n=1 Tax=Roseiterribacter gracilis TaxID=2812848 RepID=A0A8S8X8X9_9PROT|nr:SAM-dependent methyltransferase [Rhodospirillales bacterium TMPK1]
MTDRPKLRLLPRHEARVRGGHPWVFSNEIAMDVAARALPPGGLVELEDARGAPLATAYFNPRTLIAARVLGAPGTVVDRAFWHERLAAALHLRERMFDKPFYRLVHAEADRLPALIVDRMGDVLSVQANAAGIDAALDDILGALTDLLKPRAILLRNDSPVRELEGLPQETRVAHGTIDAPVEIEENGCKFLLDLRDGQKTGWFYDQRANRAFVAGFAKNARVLDLYAYAGGFALAAAKAGAREVIAVDRSAGAIEAINANAAANGLKVDAVKAEVFADLERRIGLNETYDVVIVDPPAFIKSKKETASGLRGYAKLAKLAAPLVAPGGILFTASCSHHADLVNFAHAITHGLGQAKRSGRVLQTSGAGPDHPVHPLLPESAYLKALTFQLD